MTFCYTISADTAKTNTSILADDTDICFYLGSFPYILLWTAVCPAQFKKLRFLCCSCFLLIFALWTCFLIKPHTSAAQVQVSECEYLHCGDRVNKCIQRSGYWPCIYIWYPALNDAVTISWDLTTPAMFCPLFKTAKDNFSLQTHTHVCQCKRAYIWRKFWMKIFTESVFQNAPFI